MSPVTLASNPPIKQLRIAIVGGGFGGLCLAIGLMKYQHIDVQLYEAAQEFAEIGAGVAFGPNAQRAMALISPLLREAYLKKETQNQWPSHKNTWFEFRDGRSGPDEGRLIAAVQNETGQSTAHRAHLLEELVKLVPPERTHFGKRLLKISECEDRENAGVVLHFKDGTIAEADALVGADGIHSTTRMCLLGADHPCLLPAFTDSVAYRGLIPMKKAIAAVGAEYAQNSYIWLVNGGAVLTYPIDFGETMNVVAVHYSAEDWDCADWVKPVSSYEMRSVFQGGGEHIHKVLDLLDNTLCWSIWDHPPASTFCRGLVCMMGDAAHASSPYQGQGASQAIEDALVLETLLGTVRDAYQLPMAFKAYDAVRRPRSQGNVMTSRKSGIAMFLRNPEIGDDLAKLGPWLHTHMAWHWHVDLEAQNEAALAHLKNIDRSE